MAVSGTLTLCDALLNAQQTFGSLSQTFSEDNLHSIFSFIPYPTGVIMPSFSPAQLADRLNSEGEKTIEFFKTIPVEKWNLMAYSDGEHWNIHQILTHITQAEDSVSRLIAHVVGGGAGVPDDFDLDGYNQRKVKEMQEDSPEDLIEQFSNRRARTVSFVGKLKDSDMQKTGRHPFLGIAPIEEMLKLMYRHTQLHQRDIRKLLGQE
jgi:hypothetical protein